jgi:hypothetical protein
MFLAVNVDPASLNHTFFSAKILLLLIWPGLQAPLLSFGWSNLQILRQYILLLTNPTLLDIPAAR